MALLGKEKNRLSMRRFFCLFSAVCFAVLSTSGCAKIVKTGTEAELTGETSLEDTLDVSGFWDTQAVPEVKENAVELIDFLGEAQGDLKSLAEEYGRSTAGAVNSVTYAVHGMGTVSEVNTEKSAGYAVVELDGYEGEEKIMLQIGSVIKKTSIRDYLSFINVNDYADQIEFAQVSKQINAFVLEHVIADSGIEQSEGKTIEFYGCFTCDNNEELLITPVELEVK